MPVKSQSQFGQDRWVIEEVFRGKRNGYFVDLAAGLPVEGNNTYLLEKFLGWRGLCIEPNPVLFENLKRVRSSKCCDRCIDGKRGQIEFLVRGVVSGIIDTDTDNSPATRSELIEEARDREQTHLLDAVTLQDVFEEHHVPPVIDYFSFDVEGSEARILKPFPFDKYTFLSLTVEHPTPELHELLLENEYVFVKTVQHPLVSVPGMPLPKETMAIESFYIHQSINDGRVRLEPFTEFPPKTW